MNVNRLILTPQDIIDVLNKEVLIAECHTRDGKMVYIPNNGVYIIYKSLTLFEVIRHTHLFLSRKTITHKEVFRSYNGNEALDFFNGM